MKLDQNKAIKRLVIYFFYDRNGIADRYVSYMLEDMMSNCTELFVVCNGKLTAEGRETFKKFTPHILVRENIGFDVWAYKEALEHYGWDRLAEFDEVVMMNHTIMGPVYPFAEMFEKMNQRDVDFWGITKFHKVLGDPYDTGYGCIPEHIQSHFIAVRQVMVQSNEFQKYWEDRPEICSYADAIGKHEAIFTKKFSDCGFRWGVYADTSNMEEFTQNPVIVSPVELIQNYRCPIFKRRNFFHPCMDLISYSDAGQGPQLMEYLKQHTSYDTALIWENLLRTENMADIKNAMKLNYIMPLHSVLREKRPRRVALAMHIYLEELIEYCYQYALSMPEESDIYISSGSEGTCKKIESVFKNGPWHQVKVIQVENRGRDVGGLLMGSGPYLNQYDYVCVAHDKKVAQLDYGSKGYAFSERCFHNLLGSKELVENILGLFEENPFLGLMCPPPPNHADYYFTLGCEWGPNFEVTKQLAEGLALSVSIKQDKEPVAPLGGMFWCRAKALDKLFSIDWKPADFPQEPSGKDGTILHAVERIYPFAAQDAGYYSAWTLSDEYMRVEWSNLAYMLREMNVRAFGLFGLNSFYGLTSTMEYYQHNNNNPDNPVPSTRILLKRKLKSRIPKPVWVALKKIYHVFGGKKWVG